MRTNAYFKNRFDPHDEDDWDDDDYNGKPSYDEDEQGDPWPFYGED